MEKLINEKDYLTNEVNRLEDKVNQLIKSNQESEQFYHNLIVDKENELTRLRNFLSQLTDCHQKMKSCNNNGTCDQHHPDLMEMLRSNSDPSLSCNQKSKGDKLCFRVDVSTQTIDSDYGLTGLDNQLFIPTKLGFACLNYDQLPPPPPESLLLPPQSSQLIKNEQQSESTISRETLEGINQILLAHALGQLTVADDDEEDDDDDDDDDEDDEDDDLLQECDAIEYEDVLLTRQSPNQSLGLCLSSEQPNNQGDNQQPPRNHENENGAYTRSEVYISFLETGGLAERSGAIKIGDQILEINGYEISSIDEAKTILCNPETISFELLIGRPNVHHDHSKCRERSVSKRLALFESSEHGDANHVAIVDCSQEFYILSMDPSADKNNNKFPSSKGTHLMTNGQQHQSAGGPVNSCISSGVYESYGKLQGPSDEKDSGLGKTDGESSCSQTNETCSTDHELTGSLDKIRASEPSPPLIQGTVNPSSSGHGSVSYSSGNSSAEGKRQILHGQMANSSNQFNQHQKGQPDTNNMMIITSPYNEIDPTSGQLGGFINHYEECHYASTEIVPTPQPSQHPPMSSLVKQSSPPEARSKPLKKVSTVNGHSMSQENKSNGDLLPTEMQPAEKKESIKRWIKSGLPNTLPTPLLTATSNLTPSTNSNIMSNRPSSFKPNLVQSPLEGNKMLTKNDHENRKEDKGVSTEEKATQIESDAASLMSCESCRMCIIKSQGGNLADKDRGGQRAETFHHHQTVLPTVPKRTGNLPIPVKVPVVPDLTMFNSNSNMIKSTSKGHLREEKENVYSAVGPTTTMYTTKANLEHTIMLQQEMFRQALIQQQKIKPWQKRSRSNESTGQPAVNHRPSSQIVYPPNSNNHPNGTPTSPSKHFRNQIGLVHSTSLSKFKETKNDKQASGSGKQTNDQSGNNVNMEWKIKKRPDGTRYITRKPIRSKILKERAEIINQERSGLTTDDDTMSELKVGRYWTKDERKKHSERAKDRKRREMLLRAIKMSSVRENSEEWELTNGKDQQLTGGQSSSGSSGSNIKPRLTIGSVKGNNNIQKYHGNNLITLPVDKNIQGLIKQSNSLLSSSSPSPVIVKLNGPINRATSKNQINELLTVTTV